MTCFDKDFNSLKMVLFIMPSDLSCVELLDERKYKCIVFCVPKGYAFHTNLLFIILHYKR